jgi:hypothetical protein
MKPMAIKLPFFDHGKALNDCYLGFQIIFSVSKSQLHDNQKPFDHDALDGFHIFEIRFSPFLFPLALTSASFSTQ